MTFHDWINAKNEEELKELCLQDVWKAGTLAMLEALIEKGFISEQYADVAKIEVSNIIES